MSFLDLKEGESAHREHPRPVRKSCEWSRLPDPAFYRTRQRLTSPAEYRSADPGASGEGQENQWIRGQTQRQSRGRLPVRNAAVPRPGQRPHGDESRGLGRAEDHVGREDSLDGYSPGTPRHEDRLAAGKEVLAPPSVESGTGDPGCVRGHQARHGAVGEGGSAAGGANPPLRG